MKFRAHTMVQWPAFSWGRIAVAAGVGTYVGETPVAGYSVVRRHSGVEVVMPDSVLRKRRGGMAS